MKVDFYFPPAPPGEARLLAQRAERLGFDGFFAAETRHDPFLPLLVAASAAPSLEVGTAIAVAFPRSPMVVAQTSWDLAAESEGKFILGLGTQVKAHIVRRFSGDWVSPGPRLREYVLALRAIWAAWQHASPLRFEGEHYRFSLMTPFFDPGPIRHPDIPIYVAGVGPWMARLAGEICQGLHVHPFHTIRYLDEVVLPNVRAGAERAGRRLSDVERVAAVFVVTGRTTKEIDIARHAVKMQIAFYASTPAYRPLLDLHGWNVGDRLTAMSKRGEWGAMGKEVTDEMVEELAVTAPIDGLGPAIRAKYGDRVQRVGFYGVEASLTDAEWADLVAATKG